METFQLAIHSPSQEGVELGHQYRISVRRSEAGYDYCGQHPWPRVEPDPWLAVLRGLGVGLLVVFCVLVAIRVMTKEFKDMIRGIESVRAFSDLRRWADRSGYTIIVREQASESPFGKASGGPLIFRVVVQGQGGERRWGWVRCGGVLEVRWGEPGSSFDSPRPVVSSSPEESPLWDGELDVRRGTTEA